jgi:hypothetical protein
MPNINNHDIMRDSEFFRDSLEEVASSKKDNSPQVSNELTQLDTVNSKIKTIEKSWSHFFGTKSSKQEIKKLRSERFNIITTLKESKNPKTLAKISRIANSEISQLKTKSNRLFTCKINQTKYNKLIDQYSQHSIKGKDSLKINASNITVTSTSSSGPQSFIKAHNTKLDYSFKLEIGGRKLTLEGLHGGGQIKAAGAFGRVFFGTDEKGNKVAVKVASPSNPNDSHSKQEAELKKEGSFLCRMNDSDNVLGASEVGYMTGRPPLMFAVMGHVDGQELFDKVTSESNPLKAEQKVSILQDVVSGLQDLHSEGLIHRDLKTENILVDNSTGKALLIDLGLSAETKDKPNNFVGTPQYLSPEVLKGERQGPKSDTYSLGIMIHEIFTPDNDILHEPNQETNFTDGNSYFRKNGNIKVNAGQYTGIPRGAQKKIAKLVESCLKCNPNKRPSDEDLMSQLNDIQRSLTNIS